MLTAAFDEQLLLPLGPVRNSELFSNYWLRFRLPLEPEWSELRADALEALAVLVRLWKQEKERVEKYGSEAPLEQAFIQPVLEALGWKLFYQTHVQGRKPDYALFLGDEAYDSSLAKGRTAPEFWNEATVVADAKAWHVSLDKPQKVNGKREYPPEQIEWYLDRTRLSWGILTNGGIWRLVPRQIPVGKPRFQTYLEVNLPLLLERIGQRDQFEINREEIVEFLYFYLFFGPAGFRSAVEGRVPLIDRAVLGSSEYAVGVSQNLRERVFEALRVCIQGFLATPGNGLSPEADLERCREQSFIFLYRILFIMYAEDRGLLPYRKNETYTRNRSLARQRDEIASALTRKGSAAFSKSKSFIWTDLQTLFDLVDNGHQRYEVPPYNGGLFSVEQHPFLAEKKLSDFFVAQVIDQLGRSRDPINPDAGLFRVDYRDLAIRQLGSVYEGLLELRPRYADRRIVVVREKGTNSRTEKLISDGELIPRGFESTGEVYEAGSVYLETEKGERRATGSYYTPDHIVDHIVERTLSPLCREVAESILVESNLIRDRIAMSDIGPKEELQVQLTRVEGDFDDRILRLRVLDPAMGSGHFLVRACQYLAEEIATNPNTADPEADQLAEDASTMVFWKRKVAEHCLFGVDLNPLAVELAKLALWLETVSSNQPLTFLDHHLRHGNSLVGARLESLGGLPQFPLLMGATVRGEFEARRGELLQLLKDVSGRDSAVPEDVKAKERAYSQLAKRSEGLRALGDFWCAEFFLDRGLALNPEEYAETVKTLGKSRRLATLLSQNRYLRARSDVVRIACPFHWQLEFPEVFYSDRGVRSDTGFDAIIGNPPYDVLADKELSADVSPLKRYLRNEACYEPAFHGKLNLYKLFLCRALDLLRDGGRTGLIVPMSILGDDYAVGLRKLVFAVGRFTEIHAFPQKDDPKQRVFQEAKLSTAVIGIVKTQGEESRGERFPCMRHPAADFDKTSPGLLLGANEIPLYDPDNLAIVSCSQEDWELAVRLMQSGRVTRLGELCSSYQGEVNEKTDADAGFVSDSEADGPLIMRGSNVSMYAVRDASQGKSKFLRRADYLAAKARGSKAWHSQEERVGFQRSSPQNNFRRIIAAPISRDSFCFDTVSYIPDSHSTLSRNLLLALLNSKLLDWYFTLGSTNSKVNEYQFNNLPCPLFSGISEEHDVVEAERLVCLVEENGLGVLLEMLRGAEWTPPFPNVARILLEKLAARIVETEALRGAVAKRERSRLAERSRLYQEAIDAVLFNLAGFSEGESAKLEERHAGML